MSLSKQSWNPDTDGFPNEKYRTYRNHKVAVYSSKDGKEWFFAIDDDAESFKDDVYESELDAMNAVQAFLDEHEYYKG